MFESGHDEYRSFRACLTGAGVVTPVAVGTEEFAAALRNGRRNIGRLTGVPIPRGKAAVGLVTDGRFQGDDRALLMARAALGEALANSGFTDGAGEDCGLLVSTIAGDSRTAESLYAAFTAADSADNPLVQALRTFPNGSLADSLAETFGLFGPRMVITNACASGNIALGIALDLLRFGRARRMVVVGVELVKLSMVWGAERSGFIGNDIRPFHVSRDGSVLGEGAAALVVELPESERSSRALGWLEGFGCVCDRGAAPITLLEDGSGLRRSMELSLADAGRDPHDVEYVNAHAPGTRIIDKIECKAVADLCGPHAGSVAINATKSMTTHLSGASAVVEVVATLLQMRDGFLHPTAALDQPDPELALCPVGQDPVQRQVTRSLSNACGGGGLNTTVVVTAPREPAGRPRAGRSVAGGPVVAVTGIGAVSCRGAGAGDPLEPGGARAWGGLHELDIYRWYPVETNFGYMNRAAQLAAATAAMAMDDAGLPVGADPYASDRVAVVGGTHLGGGPQASGVLCRGLLENPDAIRPSMSLDHGLHLGAALICRYFGLTGTTYTLTGSSVAGLQAVAVLRDLLVSGRADCGLGLGYDALDPLAERAFSLLPDCPAARDLSEGGAALVLERQEAAAARGARCLALLGRPAFLSGR